MPAAATCPPRDVRGYLDELRGMRRPRRWPLITGTFKVPNLISGALSGGLPQSVGAAGAEPG